MDKSDASESSVADESPHSGGGSVLRMIRDLTLELHPDWRRRLVVRPESDLDRDLGYDSLARAELMLRINREFGIGLSDQLIVDAATAGDISDAVASAAPARMRQEPKDERRPIILPQSAAPEEAETLLDALAAHVRAHPDRPHVRLWSGEGKEQSLTYGALDRGARVIAQGLATRGVTPGDRLAIMLPTGAEFLEAFFGALMAGAVPVPVYPPLRRAQIEDHLRRQVRILRDVDASALITDAATRRVGSLLHGLVENLRGVFTVGELAGSGKMLAEAFPARDSDTALIQYTSGSTGDPKGVVLSHANLLANIRAMGAAAAVDSRDVFVSWLPLYHDMGLIGAWLGSLYFAVPAVIMSPLSFIADPARWLWAIHRHKATLTAAPNFAFELCLKRIPDADIAGLDLGSLRMVLNGAEPVSPRTLSRFIERYRASGFSPVALAPVYGLAENSVGLAFPPPGRGPVIDSIERRALSEEGIARPATKDDPDAVEFASCGQPIPGHQIRIVDETRREAPERKQGRLEFKGPSATAGYFRNSEKTRALFDGDWLDSGDLAYMANGEVHLTGRVKDIIIRAGRNLHPRELEECVGDVDGVRKGCVAAVAGADAETGTERLVVVAETRLSEPAALEDLRRRILRSASAILETPPEEVFLAPPHAIPKTSSGKIRRAATRELYAAGELGKPGRGVRAQFFRLGVSVASDRIRRTLTNARDFAYAAWWWACLLLVALAVWPLVVLLPRRDWRHAVLRTGARTFFALSGIAVRVERVGTPEARAAVIVSNHMSYLDGAVLSAAFPGRLTFVVAERFGRQLIAGLLLRRLGAIFVGTGAADPHGAEGAGLQAVRAGERLVVFPEGRLRRMPGLLSFYPGPFLVAAQASAPVIPVALSGTRSILRHSHQWFPRRGSIIVHIGAPIQPEGDDFASALKAGEAARAEILAHCMEPDLGREEIGFGLKPEE